MHILARLGLMSALIVIKVILVEIAVSMGLMSTGWDGRGGITLIFLVSLALFVLFSGPTKEDK